MDLSYHGKKWPDHIICCLRPRGQVDGHAPAQQSQAGLLVMSPQM